MVEQVFLLQAPENLRLLAELTPGQNTSEKIRCPINPDHARGGARIGNLDVTVKHAPKPSSLIWSWSGDVVVSQLVLDIFRANNFRGYDVAPATLRVSGKKTSLAMYELRVSGWGGMAPPESGVRLVERCDGCGLRVYSRFSSVRRLVNLEIWDGDDFFIVWPLPRYIFVTERVVNSLVGARVSGWEAKHLDSVDCGIQLTGDRLSPGQLSYWFSQERLAQLAQQGRLPLELRL